jgi:hypothetical protein
LRIKAPELEQNIIVDELESARWGHRCAIYIYIYIDRTAVPYKDGIGPADSLQSVAATMAPDCCLVRASTGVAILLLLLFLSLATTS